jgi:hypothetical protein
LDLHHLGRSFNFRRTLTGRRAPVEEDNPLWWSWKGKTRRRYRDANVMDLANPEMRALIDLRNKPQYVQVLSPAPEQMAQVCPTGQTRSAWG